MEGDTVTTDKTDEFCVGRVEVQASAAVGRYELVFCGTAYLEVNWRRASYIDGDGLLIYRAEDLSLNDIRDADQ
jgi:hypothetical protein